VIAVDTNVLVRIIVNEEPSQAARAAAFLRTQERVFIAKTVLLELEWVLRGAYRLTRGTIAGSLRRILAFPNVEAEDPAAVAAALLYYDQGLDFADSLHVASAGRDRKFATFDGVLRRRARRLGVIKLAEL
jgi:predicted nucleic-acid-binding protein